MRTNLKLWLAGGLVVALVTLSGCSGSNDDGNANANDGGNTLGVTVPDSASSTVAAFMAYLIGLDPNDEKSEPALLKESFAVPPDEGSDSMPLG